MHLLLCAFANPAVALIKAPAATAAVLTAASKPDSTLLHAPALIEAHSAAVYPSTSERVALQASTLASVALNVSMAVGKLAVLLSSPTPK
jgi:hypothetical protein